ncbi:MAG: hypothetical protein AB2693_34070, partial [Candidatus Thiodiazotropha sp.]
MPRHDLSCLLGRKAANQSTNQIYFRTISVIISNFAHNQICLILNKVYLTKKMWHRWPFTRTMFICPGNFDEKS